MFCMTGVGDLLCRMRSSLSDLESAADEGASAGSDADDDLVISEHDRAVAYPTFPCSRGPIGGIELGIM